MDRVSRAAQFLKRGVWQNREGTAEQTLSLGLRREGRSKQTRDTTAIAMTEHACI